MRQLTFVALGIALAACGGDKDRSFVDPYGTSGGATFDWPDPALPLPTSTLRIEPAMTVAYFDTETKIGQPLAYKVVDASGADVTKDAVFGLRDARYGRFDVNKLIPSMATSDPLGVVSVVGAKVGDKFAYTHVAIAQLARTGKRRDGAALGWPNADAAPTKLTIGAGGGLYKADVAIVMDTTGSMGGSINDLVTSIIGKILPELRSRIPDVAFGLVEHKDYPLSPYGGTSDFPVKLHREITSDAESIRTALASLSADGGADLPESQVPAMFHALTGAELKWSSGTVPKREVPKGRLGALGFRPGAMPIVVLVTDIDWHEATNSPYAATAVPEAVTREQLADAFNALNARFIDITQARTSGDTEAQPNWLSDKTNSSVPVAAFRGACGAGKCCTGVSGAARDPLPDGRCRLNYLHEGGLGVSNSLINGITGLSVGTSFDVSAKITAAESGPNVTSLVASVTPVAAGDKGVGCVAHEVKDTNADGVADTFVNVPVTDSVCFEVTLAKNAKVPAAVAPTVTWAYLDLIGNPGQVLLDRRAVMIVVPAKP